MEGEQLWNIKCYHRGDECCIYDVVIILYSLKHLFSSELNQGLDAFMWK